ncbi:MAG: hypothetical protein ACRD0L_04595 [Acidimicrobiales bacterium]
MRSNTVETDALLRRVLAAHLVEGREAPPNYSVVLAGGNGARAGAGGPRELSFLYRSSIAVTRTRSAGRVVRALCSFLAGHGEVARDGLLPLAGIAIVGERAVLAPATLRNYVELAKLEGTLRRSGLRLLDAPYVTVDPGTAELVVGPPALQLDESALAGIEGDGRGAGGDGGVGPARYPIAGWGFLLSSDDPGPLTRARSVVLGMQDVLGERPLDGQKTLDALARLLAGIEPVPLSWDLDDAVRRLAGAVSG